MEEPSRSPSFEQLKEKKEEELVQQIAGQRPDTYKAITGRLELERRARVHQADVLRITAWMASGFVLVGVVLGWVLAVLSK